MVETFFVASVTIYKLIAEQIIIQKKIIELYNNCMDDMCIYIIELLCVVSKSTSLSSYLEEVCFL